MGGYLSTPVTEKESHDGENTAFKFGVAAMQGWRTEMEDAHTTILDISDSGKESGIGLFGVFDGHGGKAVAKFVARHMAEELVHTEGWKKGSLEGALADGYLRLDDIMRQEDSRAELTALGSSGAEEEKTNQPLVIGEEDIPEYMRDALIARIKAHRDRQGADPDDDWGEEECDAADHDALIDFSEEDSHTKLAEADLITKDDSDEDESEGTTDESGQDHMIEGSEDEGEESDKEASKGLRTDLDGGRRDYNGPQAGCTAVVAVIKGDVLVVANAGDSRCVCSREGTAVAMTLDHKPTDKDEMARISKAGGYVTEGRVNGSLNLSRALGDMDFKQSKGLSPAEQMITAWPDVRTLKLQPGDEFLILACDGIWEMLTNQEAVDFARQHLSTGMEPRAVCEAMCDACLAPDTGGCGKGCDNMSAMIVILKQFASPPGDKAVQRDPPVLWKA